MFKLAVGLALSSALLCTACGDDYGWADAVQPGTALFEVPFGGGLSLVAEIDIASQDQDVAAQHITIAETDSSVEVPLSPGSYSAELVDFTLFDEGEAIADVDVSFVGFEPDPIVITPFTTTRVSLTFRELESGTEIRSANSAPELHVIGRCAPACSAGQICAEVNGADVACYATCDDETPCTAQGTTCATPAGADSGLCL